jgi:hypothetical protein
MAFAALSKYHKQSALLAIALYLVSLGLPALQFEHHAPELGISLLIWGWWGLMFLNLAWLANLNFFYGVYEFLHGERRNALISSGVALALGCFSLATRNWYFNEGAPTPIASLGPGFYLWMLSFAFLLLASLGLRVAENESSGVA